MANNTKCILITLLVVIIFSLNAAQANDTDYKIVDPNKVPEVLLMLASATQANFEQIKTWQGRSEGILTYGKYRTVEFALDIEKDLLYVNDYPAELIEDVNIKGENKIKAKKGQGSQISIVSSDYYIHSKPDVIYDNVVISRKAFKEPLRKRCPTCRPSLPFVFDPRSQLSQPLVIIKKSFPLIIKKTHEFDENKPEDFVRKVEERTKNGITEYRINESGRIYPEPNSPNRLLMSSIFSSDKGLNITYQETMLQNPNETRITQKRTWDYDLVDGIYVLSKTMTRSYSLQTGKPVFYEEIVFNDIKINKPISSEVFSYKNLDLKNGDKFIDKIEGKEYKYQDANLVFVSDVNK